MSFDFILIWHSKTIGFWQWASVYLITVQ